MIKVRRLATLTGNRIRDEVVRRMREGRKRWKEKNKYGRRWFGEYVSSVKFENIAKELAFKVMIVSMFLSGDARKLVG